MCIRDSLRAITDNQRFCRDVGGLEQQFPVAAGIVGDEDAELRLLGRRFEVGGAGFPVGTDDELAFDAVDTANLSAVDADQVRFVARDRGDQRIVRTALEELPGENRRGDASERCV